MGSAGDEPRLRNRIEKAVVEAYRNPFGVIIHPQPRERPGGNGVMPKIVGIDLGTTNSLVAIVENGVPRVIPGRDGDNLVPSVIYFDEAGEVLIGNDAWAKMIDKPKNTVFSIKR